MKSSLFFSQFFFKVVEKNNKLKHSNLPIRFFKRNFITIKSICDFFLRSFLIFLFAI